MSDASELSVPVEGSASTGLVYVLTNAAMPGLVKIGITSAADPASRASQLYTTGVPVPFDVVFAGQVDDPATVERALHNAFRDNRINPRREFFRIEPDQPVELLKAFAVEDVTAAVDSELSTELSETERNSRETLRSRRPPLNFREMGIPVDSELIYREDDTIRVRVVDDKKVDFNGEITSLSAATRDIKGLDYYIQPTVHWTFGGRVLTDIYNETYPPVAE